MRVDGTLVAVTRRRGDVLVLRALGLGDMLTAIPALRGLRAAMPDARIRLATDPTHAAVVDAAGCVDAIVPVPPAVGPRPPTSLPALGGAPTVAVNLHGRGPDTTDLLRTTGADEVVAYASRDDDPAWWPRHDDAEHEVDRWCRLVDTWCAHVGSPTRCDPAALALDVPVPAGHRHTVVHIGAGAPARRWPVERFAQVVRGLRRRGRRVVVTGGVDERADALRVAHAADVPDADVLAGRLDLAGLMRTVASADLVVCGDTGVAHLATALEVASVVLFGPTDPALWGPPASPLHRVLWAGRVGDPHAGRPFAGLLDIGVDDVLAAVDTLDREVSGAAS